MPKNSDQAAKLCQLLDVRGLADLTPDKQLVRMSPKELTAAIDVILAANRIGSEQQDLITGLLLLWYDHLDAAHSIAQNIQNINGSLLHAIVHRREPDYSNAKYWFRHVGTHPVYETIAMEIRNLPPPASKSFIRAGNWDPVAFVDACQAVGSNRHPQDQSEMLKQIQKIEFKSFLTFLS
jgi:hypothetical protein